MLKSTSLTFKITLRSMSTSCFPNIVWKWYLKSSSWRSWSLLSKPFHRKRIYKWIDWKSSSLKLCKCLHHLHSNLLMGQWILLVKLHKSWTNRRKLCIHCRNKFNSWWHKDNFKMKSGASWFKKFSLMLKSSRIAYKLSLMSNRRQIRQRNHS